MTVTLFLMVFLGILFMNRTACAEIHKRNDLISLDKKELGGGKGIVEGSYAFTRDMPPKDHAIKEVGWLTLQPGHSIGWHKHETNEDMYVIVSGTGLFTDVDGTEHDVAPGDVTICRKSQSHALVNNGTEPLVFISVIAEQ